MAVRSMRHARSRRSRPVQLWVVAGVIAAAAASQGCPPASSDLAATPDSAASDPLVRDPQFRDLLSPDAVSSALSSPGQVAGVQVPEVAVPEPSSDLFAIRPPWEAEIGSSVSRLDGAIDTGGQTEPDRSPTSVPKVSTRLAAQTVGGYAAEPRLRARRAAPAVPAGERVPRTAYRAAEPRSAAATAHRAETPEIAAAELRAQAPDALRVTAVSRTNPALCEVNGGSNQGLAVGQRLLVRHPTEASRTLGSLELVAVHRERSIAQGVATRAGLEVMRWDTNGSERVEVEGVGLTADEALRDAFRNAVRLVLGAIVDAETRIEADDSLRDRVLTFSEGFVSHYEERGQSVANGLVRRSIIAWVRRGDVQLATGRIASRQVASSNLYAQALTKGERRRDGLLLARKILDLAPAQLLDAHLVGEPRVLAVDGETARVAYDIEIRIDPDRYAFAEDQLRRILSSIATRQGEISGASETIKPEFQPSRGSLFRKRFTSLAASSGLRLIAADFGEVRSMERLRFPVPTGDRRGIAVSFADEPPGPRTLVALRGDSVWQWFEIDASLIPKHGPAVLAVTLRSAGQAAIREWRLPLGPWNASQSFAPDSNHSTRTLLVSPLFLYHLGDGYDIPTINFAEGVTLTLETACRTEDLREVAATETRFLPSVSE